MAREINAETKTRLERWEDCKLVAFQDIGGVWSIGWSHTGPGVYAGLTCTQAQADAWLMQDLAKAEQAVDGGVKVPLTDNQFGALVSMVYNCGAGLANVSDGVITLKSGKPSTLLRRLNAGDYAGVPIEMARWVYVRDPGTGKPVKSAGLVNRRNAEIGLWSAGSFVSSRSVTPEAPPTFWRHPQVKRMATALGGVTTAGMATAGQQLLSMQSYCKAFVFAGLVLAVGSIVLGLFKHE